MKLIERDKYLKQLIDVVDTPYIKVITGIRRCGKSKLMDMFIDYLLKNNKEINIIRIKLNLKKFEKLKDPNNLYNFVDSQYIESKENYLFIDEVQMCKNFETIINSFHEEERFHIFLTGSNAFILSSDLATLFGGRIFEISLFPFSFKEYLKYFEYNDIDVAFDDYVNKGGMPGSYLYKNEKDSNLYLKNIVKTTITKDIVTKFHIENENLLNMIVEYLMDNISNKTSIKNISNCLTSNTYKTNDKTCASYIDYLCKCFLFYPVKQYDVKGKKYLESNKKILSSRCFFSKSEKYGLWIYL